MNKLTKIVATISDKRCEVEFLKRLHEEGMDVVRLNTAHLTTDKAKMIIDNIRKVSDKIPVLIDTKGPELRTTETPKGIHVIKGDVIKFKGDPYNFSTAECICVSYPNFANELSVGDYILIDDGEIEFKVIHKEDDFLLCQALNEGVVESRKSINLPGISINLPSLNPKDIEFIEFATENDVSFIAHSFVRHKADIIDIQNILDKKNSSIKIIAKIENQQGVDNIDEILEYAYGVMIARGDLGIEIPAEKIPAIQKEIQSKCIAHRKPVIVATQMLHTMIRNPRPTRAEVSDVANAIYDGTDAIMLSGETAYGLYPAEAVRIMSKIATEAEKVNRNYREVPYPINQPEIAAYLCKSAVKASVKLQTKAIIADSKSGRTIRDLAAYRGHTPIYAICYDENVMRELALSYGVFVEHVKPRNTADEFIHEALTILKSREKFKEEDLIVVLAGNFGTSAGASFFEISTLKELLDRQQYFLDQRKSWVQ